MTQAVRTIQAGNMTLEIFVDNYASNPRDWENLGTIVAWSRHGIGDEFYPTPRDFLEDYTYHHFKTQEGLEDASDERLWELFEKENIVLPVYMYDHSVIILSTTSFIGRAHHAEWDSGKIGWIFVSKEKVRREYNVKRITKKIIEKVEKVLTSEIETYSDYINGDVYGYVLKEDDEEIDSVWGFYGCDFKENGMTDELPQEIASQL